MTVRVAAVDLGATSGRIMAGTVSTSRLRLDEVHRFPNAALSVGDDLVWDIRGIHCEVLVGVRAVRSGGPLHGIGIDSWAVDYGLLGRGGALLGNPHSHRDTRTDGVAAQVLRTVDARELYAVTGVQHLPFNTVYQLVAAAGSAELKAAETLLLLPDLLTYWLTGEIGAERTNASTTQLYDVTRGAWALDLARRLGISCSLLPPLRDPGTIVGPVRPDVSDLLDLDDAVPVVAVGSHDTASAVVSVPAEGRKFAYISSGTWSLVGLELERPVLTEQARLADFTNETGVDGTIRFLKNVMGLWVLSEAVRSWAADRRPDTDLPELLAGAARAPALRTVIDIDDPRLLAPGDLPARIRMIAEEAGEPVPGTPVSMTRCVLDSLALAYRGTVRAAAELSGQPVDVVHIVGGGSQNALLCQLTADACELPVLAGPTEAAALGNTLVQARTLGVDLPDLDSMRDLVRRSHEVHRYEPSDGVDWSAAEARIPSRSSRTT